MRDSLKNLSYDLLREQYPLNYTTPNYMIWIMWADMNDHLPVAEKARIHLVKNNGLYLAYIKNPSDKVIKAAFSDNVYAIGFMKDQEEEYQIRAIKKYSDAYSLIREPTFEANQAFLARSPSNILIAKNPTPDQVVNSLIAMIDYDPQYIGPTITKYQHILDEQHQIILAAHLSYELRYFTNLSIEAVKESFLRFEKIYGSTGFTSSLVHLSNVLSRDQKAELFRWNNKTMMSFGYDESIIRENIHYITDPALIKLFVQSTQDDESAILATMQL